VLGLPPWYDALVIGHAIREDGDAMSDTEANTHEPAPAGQVFDGVYEALRRHFGSAADVEEVQRDDTEGTATAIYGFTVDGVNYSLAVNQTP
jgi:hypothetical protein